MPTRHPAGIPHRPPLTPSGFRLSHRPRHRAEQIPPAAPPCFALPSPRPSMPIASCTAGLSKRRAGGQPPKPGRPPPLLRLTAPPFAPGSTAGGARLQPRHPLQALLLDSPEGPSFAQRARLGYTPNPGSDRTLTHRRVLAMPIFSRALHAHPVTRSSLMTVILLHSDDR